MVRRSRKSLFIAIRCGLLFSVAWLGLGSASSQSQTAAARTFHVLYTFTGGTDGAQPYSGLIQDASGNLYGTTFYGGSPFYQFCCGTVFKVSQTGVETILYAFTSIDPDCGGTDGSWPAGILVADTAGNLYGTATGGGICDAPPGNGVVFKLDSAGTEIVLHAFGRQDGDFPLGLIRDASSGTLYGATPNSDEFGGPGTIYSVDQSGNESILFNFSGGIGGGPYGDLLRTPDGTLYGTAAFGGSNNDGVVFKVDPAGKETVIHTFAGSPNDGAHPYAGLLQDRFGNNYGTTFDGGAHNAGTVYKIDTSGNLTILYSFTGSKDGGHPYGGLVRDSAGNFYGTTTFGGIGTCTDGTHQGCGVVFRVNTKGKETVLHRFTGGADGAEPYFGTLTRDAKGNLFGTASFGGTGNGGLGNGVVFAITAKSRLRNHP